MKAFFTGIRFRLMAWFNSVLLVVLVVFSVFVYGRQQQDLHDLTVQRLAIKTSQLESLMRFEHLPSLQDVRQLMPTLISGGVALVQEDEVFVVADAQAQWSAQVGPVSQGDITRMIDTARQVVQTGQQRQYDFSIVDTATNENQEYVFLITPVVTRNVIVGYVLLGRPGDPGGQLPRLLVTLGLASLAVLAVASGGGYWLAGRILRPVKAITRAARQISDTDLSRRLNLRSSDELGELANTFDSMLTRLQAAFERQRQFTADASHELRTPLTIIGLETDRALSGERDAPEYQRTLEVIRGENAHMTRLVNDLLVLARLESGQARLKQEPVDLSDIALDVMERLSPLARAKGIHLEAGELPAAPVLGDSETLGQMISNLVGNAIKYAPAGSGMVQVETGVSGGKAWVRVVDNGPGIPPEDQPHLFERFYRSDKTRGRVGEQSDPGGSGLGLAIVRWVALAHGGEVKVESALGAGATFEAALPSYS